MTDQRRENTAHNTPAERHRRFLQDAPRARRLVRDLVGGLAILSALCVAAGAGIPIALAVWRQEPWLLKQYEEHFAAVVGMPACALLAFLLVVLLEARYDRVEIEFFGIVRFRGAAGPIILWVFCFFIMACGVKMLW
ncbi:hypothetical protein [Streptomyces soliscabiei]|uniref:hypothetical protein n=1 Tax=Streptomyces soliscabiei TaxID=588897 RepID=UPI0029B518F7|nr:hypothetical protein [Streptomyces sp. NY05-11A]MDX2678591.1 hypothetical protein [Streptomyces sp. NY05-11A]